MSDLTIGLLIGFLLGSMITWATTYCVYEQEIMRGRGIAKDDKQ